MAHWRNLTAGDELEETLARLDEDEQVALERRTIERMRESAVLLDIERLIMAAAARLTYHAPEYDGAQPLGAWVEAQIDQAIEDLLNEDAIEDRDQRPLALDDPRYFRLALQMQVDPRTFRRGTVVFHRAPHEERAAFWAVFVDGRTIAEHARATGVSPFVAQRRFDRAVTTFCSLGAIQDPLEDDDPPTPWGGAS